MNKKVQIEDLGSKEYQEAWDYQVELFDAIVAKKMINRNSNLTHPTKNYLIFVEHPHVYTIGKSGDLSNLLLNEKQLKAKGATPFQTIFGSFAHKICVT